MSGVNAYTGRANSLGPLFDHAKVPPLSRTGQTTSQEAEKEIRETGALGSQCAQTLAALMVYVAKRGDWPTCAELAGNDPALIRIYSKRLPNLARLKRVKKTDPRVCMETGRRCFTWRPL